MQKEGDQMGTCTVHPLGTFTDQRFVVVISRMNGEYLFSRHKNRTTWETQGGHIEPGETPLEAAKRELWEESGAQEFTIEPLCDYYATDDIGAASGVVFKAEIASLGRIPENSEMAETRSFSERPENFTYPDITPVLLDYEAEKGR